MNDKVFGEWLKKQRKVAGFTQESFAYKIGYSIHMLRKIESGERAISRDALQLVAQTLNQDIAALIEYSASKESLPTHLLEPEQLPLFPVWTTPFIGREQELAQLTELFDNSKCRLITLFGPGGAGKTRLAVAYSQNHIQQHPERVYFVSLESTSPELSNPLLWAIISAFQFSLPQHEELLPPVIAHLQQSPTLLILDNFEHLVAKSASVLVPLLSVVETLKIVVTSRRPLNIQPETIYPISGLAADASQQLFINHAQKHWLGVDIETDSAAVGRICQWMEGMPLGIELAAIWSRTIPCTQIIASLEKGEIDWDVPSKDIPDRHRNLQQIWTFAWERLSLEEQAILYQCSVFEGGFTYDAVTEVTGVTIELLFKLHDQGWLQRWENDRYRIHSLPLAFLRNMPRLKSEASPAYQRHADYYATFIANHIAPLRDNSAAEVKPTLTPEMANFEQAWDWYLETKNVVALQTYIPDLFFLYRTTWHLPLFIQKLTDTIASTNQLLPEPVDGESGKLLRNHCVSDKLSLQGGNERLPISLTTEPAIVGEWQRLLAESYFRIGKLETSIDYYRQTLETIGSPYPSSTKLGLLKPVARYIGHRLQPSRAKAIDPISRSAALAHEKLGLIFYLTAQDQYVASSCIHCYNYALQCGDDEAIAHASMNLSFAWAMLGQPKQAQFHINQALEAAVRCNNPRVDADMAGGQMVYYSSIGEWDIAQKRGRVACNTYEKLELWREYGEATLTLVMIHFLDQDYQNCIQRIDRLIELHQYNESDHFFLSLVGQAYCYIRLQKWTQVDKRIQQMQKLITKVQPVGMTAQLYHTVMGLWLIHNQAYEKALFSAQTTYALLQPGARTFNTQPSFTGAIQICLQILNEDNNPTLLRQARALIEALFADFDKFCRRYPFAQKSYYDLHEQWLLIST